MGAQVEEESEEKKQTGNDHEKTVPPLLIKKVSGRSLERPEFQNGFES